MNLCTGAPHSAGRLRGICLAAALLAGVALAPAEADAVPNSSFVFRDEAELFDRLSGGEFNVLLEVHLTDYASDPAWTADWAASRYTAIGILAEQGSLTGRRLFVHREIAVRVPVSDRLAFRYDRREWEDTRFSLGEERFDATWFFTEDWGLMAAGWPTHRKEEASAGLGIAAGSPESPSQVRALLMDERFAHNRKTSGPVRFDDQPLRLLVDGYGKRDAFRWYGSLNWGLAYRARVEPEDGGPRTTAVGYLRHGDLGADFEAREWTAGVRGRFALERLDQKTEDDPGSRLLFDRQWGRIELHARRDLEPYFASGLIAYARQRDVFAAPSAGRGAYEADVWLFGLEGGYRVSAPLELRLGYTGSPFLMDRNLVSTPSDTVALADQHDSGYEDKLHLKALVHFRPGASLQFLLSREVSRQQFGGASVNALLLF